MTPRPITLQTLIDLTATLPPPELPFRLLTNSRGVAMLSKSIPSIPQQQSFRGPALTSIIIDEYMPTKYRAMPCRSEYMTRKGYKMARNFRRRENRRAERRVEFWKVEIPRIATETLDRALWGAFASPLISGYPYRLNKSGFE